MNLLLLLATLAALSVEVTSSRRWLKKKLSPNRRPADKKHCLLGNGSTYRGSVSKSSAGNSCLNWKATRNPWGASEGIGDHNYCRNPDKSVRPWCRVQLGSKILSEYCDIPKCSTAVKPPLAVDTELTCGESSEGRLNKIVGGSVIPIESQPWVTAIFYGRNGFLCGGSLITPCWVVTAAHCFRDRIFFNEKVDKRYLSVFLGKSTMDGTDAAREQRFSVEKLIIHENYNVTGYENDIALLQIRSKDGGCAVRSPSARTVCLPPAHTQLPAGFQCTIAGFGLENYETWQRSKNLKEAQVKLISKAECKKKSEYSELLADSMFCAASPDWSADACKGDSGGPLVCKVSGRMFLFGVVSWGIGCAIKDKPGVYTQVTSYNKWIAMKTKLTRYTTGIMFPKK